MRVCPGEVGMGSSGRGEEGEEDEEEEVWRWRVSR